MSAIHQRRDRAEELSSSCIPETVRDEVLLPARGETRYELVLGDEEVEVLSTGVCPDTVARQAYGMLRWKRDLVRKADQDKAKPLGAV